MGWLAIQDKVIRSQLNKCGYQFLDVQRTGRTGGGTGIICKQELSVKALDTGSNNTFEYIIRNFNSLTNGSVHNYVIVIYRPPYSAAYPTSVNTFCEEFSDYISGILAKQTSVIITGDFNIHVNDRHDADKLAFDELLDCLNLQQYVTCPTHQSGNTLDLLLNVLISFYCRNHQKTFTSVITALCRPCCQEQSQNVLENQENFVKLTK